MAKDKITDSEAKGWECVERQEKEEQNEFKITEFGVYAVILNPLREKVNYFGYSSIKNFFFENIKVILIVLGIIIVLAALIFYIFVRVTRYRKKYHDNREKIILMKQQREEYESMTTDIFGQTLGDNINGMVYKANPAYSVSEEIKKQKKKKKDEIEKLQLECKNVTEQNERLQKDINEITKKYEELSGNWKELPLSDSLSQATHLKQCMDGGCKDIYERYMIPTTINGYYYFLDRHSEAKEKHDDSIINERSSYNFTLAIIEKETNIIYYYELDT